MDSRDMNKHKNNTNRSSNGFGLQKDITSEGATIYLRITNPRRLNSELLWGILRKHFMGGYNVLILDQGKGQVKRVSFANFLSALKAAFEESQYRRIERRLSGDRVVF